MATTGPFLDEAGVSALWSKCKAWFGRKLGVSPASTTVDVQLQNEGGTTLATGTIPAATQSAAGVLTAADKTKLDGVATGATKVTVDSSLSSTSTNPLQNKAINSALAGKAPNAHASASTTYGIGTDSNYGHVRLTDATTSTTSAASGGYAASPKAVSDALAAAKAYADGKADQDTKYGLSISGHTVSLVEDGDTASVTVPDNNTTYTLSGALSSHKVTSTLTPSSGTATTSDFTLAAGTGITITDDATNRKMTIATTAEANQNAFSNVKVGSTTIAADAKTDTLTLAAGSNVTLTPDATNDKVTIAATDTTYSDFTGATASAAGTHGLVPAQAKIPSGSSAYQFTLRGSGRWQKEIIVTTQDDNGLAIQKGYVNESGSITDPVVDDIDSIIPLATTSGNGVMSAADKTKLNGIATGAEVNQSAFSNVKVGSTTIAADAKTDTLELVAGSNVTITPDATNDKITIAATDTTYSDATTSAHGLMSKTDKGKLDTVSYNATAVSWNESTRVLTITEQTTSTGGSTSDEVQIPSSYTHPSYTAASAAAVKVGRDATGHVVIGDALTASDVGASATGHKHAAGDITSGTLGVARGGTGASTLGAGVVYHSASGTGALSIATAANLVSALGTTAVNRATADANGDNIASTYAKKSDISGLYKFRGSVDAATDLPSTGQAAGDVYDIKADSDYGPAGTNVAWVAASTGVEAHWDALGASISVSAITAERLAEILV